MWDYVLDVYAAGFVDVDSVMTNLPGNDDRTLGRMLGGACSRLNARGSLSSMILLIIMA